MNNAIRVRMNFRKWPLAPGALALFLIRKCLGVSPGQNSGRNDTHGQKSGGINEMSDRKEQVATGSKCGKARSSFKKANRK